MLETFYLAGLRQMEAVANLVYYSTTSPHYSHLWLLAAELEGFSNLLFFISIRLAEEAGEAVKTYSSFFVGHLGDIWR